jgi:hypothetical protein
MELVKEVTQGARVSSEKGENWRRGRNEEKKQEMALKEKSDIVILRWRKSPRWPQSKAKLLPAHHITLSSFRKSGATACSCQGGLL